MCIYTYIYVGNNIYIGIYTNKQQGGYVGGTVEYGKGGDLGEKAEKIQHSSFL